MVTRRCWLRWPFTVLVLVGVVLASTIGAAKAAGAAGTVVASGLANPRGLAIAADGTIFVSEAGLSGPDPFIPGGAYPPSTRGSTGRVTKITANRTKSTVTADLPSLSLGGNDSPLVIGPAGLALDGETLWLGNGAMVNGAPQAPNAAKLLRIDTRSGAVSTGADIGAHERSTNPDGFELTSNPYGVTLAPGGIVFVTDAGGNTLYRYTPSTGQLAVVTVFTGLAASAPSAERGGKVERDPVPTGVAPGPGGSVYVGLLGGGPFPVRTSKILLVAPNGSVSDAVTGLTSVVDLAVGPDRLLYAVEIGEFDESQGFGWKPGSGRVLRIRPDRSTQMVADGLETPNGIAFDRSGNLFVTVNSSTAPKDGPQGQILRIDSVAAPSVDQRPHGPGSGPVASDGLSRRAIVAGGGRVWADPGGPRHAARLPRRNELPSEDGAGDHR